MCDIKKDFKCNDDYDVMSKPIKRQIHIKKPSYKSLGIKAFDIDEGLLILEIENGSIGERAGLIVGDVIVGLDDKDISMYHRPEIEHKMVYDSPLVLTILEDSKLVTSTHRIVETVHRSTNWCNLFNLCFQFFRDIVVDN